jgi:hypothetical protein
MGASVAREEWALIARSRDSEWYDALVREFREKGHVRIDRRSSPPIPVLREELRKRLAFTDDPTRRKFTLKLAIPAKIPVKANGRPVHQKRNVLLLDAIPPSVRVKSTLVPQPPKLLECVLPALSNVWGEALAADPLTRWFRLVDVAGRAGVEPTQRNHMAVAAALRYAGWTQHAVKDPAAEGRLARRWFPPIVQEEK